MNKRQIKPDLFCVNAYYLRDTIKTAKTKSLSNRNLP